MKTAVSEREVHTGGVQESASFGISASNEAHIIAILREGMYSDKVLAVLREYGSNAWDANRAAGKQDTPIKVTLPDAMDPELRIRDFGPGLSKEQVFTVFNQYGSSTKRDSDDYVGMLGIGSKSGFAYSDSFSFISWYGGVKSVYSAVIDKSEKGTISLLYEEPLPPESSDETGVEIVIAVKKQDIGEFTTKAVNLYRHFSPRPTINAKYPDDKAGTVRTKLKTGEIVRSDDRYYGRELGWYVIMGCVPYPVKLDQFYGKLPAYVDRVSGGYLYANIGDIQIAASREELKYSEKTKASVVKMFEQLGEEFMKWALEAASDDKLSDWEKRVRLLNFGIFNLKFPPAYEELTRRDIAVRPMTIPGIVLMKKNYSDSLKTTEYVTVTSGLRFVVKNDMRSMKGYAPHLTDNDIFVVPAKEMRSKDLSIVPIFEKFVKDNRLTGVPTVLSSTMPWTATSSGASKAAKHSPSKKSFRLKDGQLNRPFSTSWEVVDRNESDKDVYVNIHGFCPNTMKAEDFNNYLRVDKEMVGILGETMPNIYGYKAEKDETWAKRKGKSYLVWRAELHDRLLKNMGPDIRQYLIECVSLDTWNMIESVRPSFINHPVGALMQEIIKVRFKRNRTSTPSVPVDWARRNAVRNAVSSSDTIGKSFELEVKNLLKPYPLLEGRINSLFHKDSSDLWIDYIELVDRDNMNKDKV